MLAMRACEGVKVYFHTFLISALDGIEWSVSRPERFTPEWKNLFLYVLNRRVVGGGGTQSRCGSLGEGKISRSPRNRTTIPCLFSPYFIEVWSNFCYPLCSLAPAKHHTDNSKTKAPNTTGINLLYNTLELLMMGIMVSETRWASNKICNKNHLLHLVGILFPQII
jgi:hypothetical protein